MPRSGIACLSRYPIGGGVVVAFGSRRAPVAWSRTSRALKCQRRAAAEGDPAPTGSVLRSRRGRSAAGGLAAARRATGGLAAAGGGCAAAGAAGGLASRCGGIRCARGRAVSAATPDRRADEHSRHGRNCQSLRKIHSFLVSSLLMKERLPWGLIRRLRAGVRDSYAPSLSRYRLENGFFWTASCHPPATARVTTVSRAARLRPCSRSSSRDGAPAGAVVSTAVVTAGVDRAGEEQGRVRRPLARHARPSARTGPGARSVADSPADRAKDRAPLRARDSAQGSGVLREPAQPPWPATPDAGRRPGLPRARGDSCARRSGRIVQTCRVFLAEGDRAFVFQRYLETVLPDDRARTRLAGESAGAGRARAIALRLAARDDEPARGHHGPDPPPARAVPSSLRAAGRRAARDRADDLLQSAARPRVSPGVRSDHQRADARADANGLRRAGAPPRRAHRSVSLSHASLRLARREHRSGADRHARGARWRSSTSSSASSVPTRARSRGTFGGARGRSSPAASRKTCFACRRSRSRSTTSGCSRAATSSATSRRPSRASLRASDSRCAAPSSATSRRSMLARRSTRCARRCRASRANLRPALQHAVMFLGRSLGARLDARGVFDDETARRTLSERLRRDVWMFAQIVRAFAVKARAVKVEGQERWLGGSPLDLCQRVHGLLSGHGIPAAACGGLSARRRVSRRHGEPPRRRPARPRPPRGRGRGGRALSRAS